MRKKQKNIWESRKRKGKKGGKKKIGKRGVRKTRRKGIMVESRNGREREGGGGGGKKKGIKVSSGVKR